MSYICRKIFRMRPVVIAILLLSLVFNGCSPNNVTVDDSLGRYFDSAGVKGTFGLFDNGQGHFTIYNLPGYRDSFNSPGQTFDILQSLIAIQTGVVKDDSSTMSDILTCCSAVFDNHKPFTFGDYFRDTSESEGMAFYYLAKRIGKDSLRKWIDSLQYGNKKMGDSAGFWEDGTLRINSDEQLGLLKKLYFNQLPFFARTQEIVQRMMATESNSVYRLSYKTALGKMEDGHGVGWVMGWVEENKHPYFFVVNLESADGTKDLRQTGLMIAKKILQEEGFFEGKK
jgi:beta-lactamase class D